MPKNIVIVLLLVLLVGSFAGSVSAWDETGHKIVAYIAWQQMTPEVRERVIKTLISAPEDSQIATFYLAYGSRSPESKKREFFMIAATWPDIVRDRAFETRFKKYNNSNWHYSDTFWKWEGGKAVAVEGIESNGLALQKIGDLAQVIRSEASDADKAVAIAWLEHLVGDIHQPLHASGKVSDSNPKGDQGGNLFLLTPKGTPREKQLNLHSYWDSIVGQNQPNSSDRCDTDYIDPIAADIIKAFPYEKEKNKLSDGKYDVWASESFEIATSFVYKDIKFFELPAEKYKKKAFEIAQERMALAGYRLADLFNEAFGSRPATIAESSIPCKVIRKVMYPVTQTSSVKQTLEIALLDLCPTQIAARPMYSFMIDGKVVMKEYDVTKTFKTEAEAKKYAAENNVKDIAF